jgi:Domain of unknown function (DUF6089)
LLRSTFLYLFCLLNVCAFSQSRKRNFIQREIGLFAGGSYYIGDINPRGHFFFTKPALGGFYRYSPHYRYAFKLGLNYGKLTASDAKSKEADQRERNLFFTTNLFEGSAVAEFNFVDYRIGNDKHKFTMYVFAGIAMYYFNPKSDRGNGLEALRKFNTEGQKNSYDRFQTSIPFGVGVKLNLTRRIGLGIEWGPRRTFTDYIDDVSGSYPALAVEGDKGFTNRSLNGAATPGSMRGNPSTKDWYFYYGVTLNFKLPEAHRACHRSL